MKTSSPIDSPACPLIAGIWRIFALVSLMLGGSLLGACATTTLRNPVPAALVGEATVPHLPLIRYWADEIPANIEQVAGEREQQIRASRRSAQIQRSESFLALSGGGGDGAFGAGLLVGWTASGKRPEFEVVTGISTGALIAPFAFVGSSRDNHLQEIYTSYETKDLVTTQIIAGLLGAPAVTDDAPFKALIAKYVNARLLAAVAVEHRKGRRLLVGTTNLDAQRAVIWDLGAIAASGSPHALQLFRDVLRASASIPGAFPPVRIDVEAGGELREELHVDGGTTQDVFFLPKQVLTAVAKFNGGRQPKRTLYVIRNSKLAPEYEPVEATTLTITARSISTLLKSQAQADAAELYELARDTKMDFNLAAIPTTFTTKSEEPFDKAYMQELFALGYELGRTGFTWEKIPQSAKLR